MNVVPGAVVEEDLGLRRGRGVGVQVIDLGVGEAAGVRQEYCYALM